MRRTVLLGAVAPVLALGFVACAQAVLLAQSPKTPGALSPPTSAPARAASPFGSEGAELPASAAPTPRVVEAASPALDALPIRQRFIELSKKKAQALTEEQLKHEVETMEAEVRELEAWAKAQEAVRLLHEVIEKHPNTKAAETANAAIQLIDQRRVSPRSTRETPRPDTFTPGTFEPAPGAGRRPESRPPDDRLSPTS